MNVFLTLNVKNCGCMEHAGSNERTVFHGIGVVRCTAQSEDGVEDEMEQDEADAKTC